MSNNREFSQLASFINVDENNNFIGIATDGTQLVGIGTSSITLDGRTGIISARDLYLDGVNITDIIGTPEYVQNSGVSTSVIGGIASVTQLSVSGISTFSNDVEVGTGITFYAATGIISATAFYGSGQNLTDIIGTKLDGITVKEEGSSLPSAYGILDFVGDYVTATGVGTTATITFVAPNYASNSGVATYADTAGIATYATSSGIATYATSAGIATNIKGGDAGDIPYQTAADTTSFIDASTAAVGQVILWNGSVPYWGNVSAASGSFGGITVEDEGTPVGTSGSITSLNFTGNNISVEATAGANGIATITVADYVSTAGVATALQNTRTFEITGDVVASPISFDGTGNVSLAATIQPNSVGLGTDTFGDYVKDISGTANEIVVTGGTGEGSTPVISFAPNPTIGGNVTIGNDLQINNNLNVTGTITIGGTTAIVYAEEFRVADKDIVLGFTTDSFGNDVSNDTTANGGGVAIASTEGSPLVCLQCAGINTFSGTYKQLIWFKSGAFSGLNTDAWLSNYAIGIGSTQVPNGVRLAAGGVQLTDNDIIQVRNINASGIITGTLANDLTLDTSGIGLSGIATYNNSGAATFTVTSNATDANTNSTIVARDGSGNFSAGTITANLTGTATTATKLENSRDFSVSGDVATSSAVSFDGTGNVDLAVTLSNDFSANTSGIITASSFVGNLTGTATTATNLSDAANITTGTISSDRLTGTYAIDISGNASTATYASTAGIATYATTAGTATTATNIDISATSTEDTTTHIVLVGDNVTGGQQPFIDNGSLTYNGSTNILTAGGFSGDGSALTDINGSQITSGTITGDRGVTSGSTSSSFIEYNGTTKTSGQFDGGTTNPSSTTRLNYDGYFYATRLYSDSAIVGSAVTIDSSGIVVTGIITATDFNSASDAKLKTNIQPVENPIEKVAQINGVTFNWIKDNNPSMGVIANEVQKVLPELVSDTDPKTVNYNGLIGLLIEVVKEQQTQIQTLENRISRLES